ncbi:beta-ketoacyl-[acyl-carrier-protein] synthase family protein [Streptomyces hygroscopicus]|uniref:beta-ketoacyl-[acyl-carrier-protein] synthase family protein n=1 Tax=Streptomyces hygroscopicus TaxID=1912 RepID=UPI00223F355C|nr:beta-ketoacyl synthase N-terminal-like domain-containing protein [Streptomyces hygroscopicus]
MIPSDAHAVAGIGALASVGSTTDEIFESLCAGRSGLAPMRGFDPDCFGAGHLYEIDDRPATGDVPLRATAFLLDAVAQALADAGLGDNLGGIPVLVGSGLRELRSVELRHRGAAFDAAQLHFGTALRRRFGATMTHTVSNACSASLYALAMGTDLLDAGAADTVVVAGVDSITESMFANADRLQSVPPDTVRPFDRDRRGTILGEGAAAVVLRRGTAPDAARHGAVRGVAVNCDAQHATAPDRVSIAAAMRDAYHRAAVTPSDIDLVMLHGTGTHANDEAEAGALAEVFGPQMSRPLMTAMKSMTGHTSGASGLHSLITALQSFRRRRVPPTLGLDHPIEQAAGFRFVRGAAAPSAARLAQINAFGFGGINAVAIVEAP